MKLAARIRRHGMTQVEFARVLGVHPVTVCNWVRGRRVPRDRHVPRLCRVLGCRPRDLGLPPPRTKRASGTLGAMLRTVRLDLGMKQSDFAAMVRVPVATDWIRRLECRGDVPDSPRRRELLRVVTELRAKQRKDDPAD